MGGSDVSLVNALFDTTFEAGTGISMEALGPRLVLYSSFDRMFSDELCGSKAMDFHCALPGITCVAVRAVDIDATLRGYEQIFRRLLLDVRGRTGTGTGAEAGAGAGAGAGQQVVFFVDEDSLGEDMESTTFEYEGRVVQFLGRIWAEESEDPLESAVAVKVVLVRGEDAVVQQARDTFADVEATAQGQGQGQGLPLPEVSSHLVESWRKLPVSPIPVLSPRQRESLYAVEAAYTAGLTQADVALSQWQERIVSGRTVGRFASRVAQLLSSVRKDFNQRTSGAEVVRERGERLRLLREHVLTSAQRLFRQQLLIVEFKAAADFKRALLVLASREGEGLEEQQAALRRAVLDSKAACASLEDEALGLSLTEERVVEVTAVLEGILRGFPDSPAAKLEEVKRLERQARAGARGFGERKRGVAKALGVSLSLVGMLRPPGFGNLQGFVGYATSMLGLPLELLLGVQNDGDSPEVMGEDREYPILRMQPKVHFDVDL
ncbi:hypothetical protein B484DRAFT_418729 [Ochromonadaceae sp. CCMP2298]|nr:hypothetical protein B484DRAFT_418729 [Ochromonadaceae sp. CCMP2298]